MFITSKTPNHVCMIWFYGPFCKSRTLEATIRSEPEAPTKTSPQNSIGFALFSHQHVVIE